MCDFEFSKACKIDEYLGTKNYLRKKRLIGKLVLEYEDEILNTTETLLIDKKVACARNNCLIYTFSLVIICFLLLALVFIIQTINQSKNINYRFKTQALN